EQLPEWGNATLVLNRVNGTWKLNTSKSFAVTCHVPQSSDGEEAAVVVKLIGDTNLQRWTLISDGIQDGRLATTADASDAVHQAMITPVPGAGRGGVSIHVGPAIPHQTSAQGQK